MSVLAVNAGAHAARIATYIVAAWSGFFVLSVELLSSRLLAPYFGSSIFVWGGILTTYMLALSLGYLLGGVFSTRQPRLWKLAALLAAEALLTLPVIEAEPLLEAISIAFPDPRWGSIISSMCLFAIPTVISGMVSPYCIRLLVRGIGSSGREAGLVYFVSTIGSAAGTIGTGFFLVLVFDVYRLIAMLAVISLLVAAVAASLSYQLRIRNDD
ncbi:MAG: fused MFS/spermidine synthase [Giesbergeria sp.]